MALGEKEAGRVRGLYWLRLKGDLKMNGLIRGNQVRRGFCIPQIGLGLVLVWMTRLCQGYPRDVVTMDRIGLGHGYHFAC